MPEPAHQGDDGGISDYDTSTIFNGLRRRLREEAAMAGPKMITARIVLCLFLWACASILTFGALHAQSQCRWSGLDQRDLAARDMFFSMLPPMQLFSWAGTGFYRYGWTLSTTGCQDKSK